MEKIVENSIIEQEIEWFSEISDTFNKEGVTRLLYSDKWVEAQEKLSQKLRDLDLNVHYDEIGNMFARLEGSEFPDEVIATGSHIDTVVNGGRLDGQLGIIAGYLAIDYLKRTYGQPKRSLELFIMAEEEGSRFPYAFWGSKNIFGLAKRSEVEDTKDANGIVFQDAMRDAGFDFKNDDSSKRTDIKAFIEIHIEQGITLEKQNLDVGIVNSIVGQKRFTVTLEGQSNHAGTTKMSYRKDTVHCFSKFATKAYDKALEIGDPLVLTFGHVTPEPNTVNVVPGRLTFMIDTRHTSQEELDSFEKFLVETLNKTGEEFGVSVTIDKWMDAAPVAMSEDIISILEKNAKELELDYIVMHSGAGHDAQIIAPFVPTSMIFTPSINGISHNPLEATDVKYLNIAITLLTKSLFDLAY